MGSRATYELAVDWDKDGSYATAGDDVSARVTDDREIVAKRGRDQIRMLAPPMAGTFEAEIDNDSQDYSYENASSPIGDLDPGAPVRLRSTFSAVTYNLWRGVSDQLEQHPEFRRRTVTLPALGLLSVLAGKRISTALYQNITTDVALGHVLDAVGLTAAGDRNFSTGKTTLLWWWAEDQDALTAVKEILASEGPPAAVYEDGQGRINFEDRHFRVTTTRSTTSQATLRDQGTEPVFSLPYLYDAGAKSIFNAVSVVTQRRSVQGTAVVWTLGETVTLAPNESREYRAYSADPFQSAITPVASTDYTVSAGSLSSVALDRTSGQSVNITLTAGSSGATVTGLQLRADAVTVDNETKIEVTLDVSASRTRHGTRRYPIALRQDISPDVTQDLVNAIASFYDSPRPTVQLALWGNRHDDAMVEALAREISDRITVVESQTGVNEDFHIEQIEYRIRPPGGHTTLLGAEKVGSGNPFIVGTSELDGPDLIWH